MFDFVKDQFSNISIAGWAEEITKFVSKSNIPLISNIAGGATFFIDRAKDNMIVNSISSAKENIGKIGISLKENSQALVNLKKDKDRLEQQINNSTKEQKEQLLLQKQALDQLEQALNTNNQELLNKQNDLERAMQVIQNNSLTQQSKLQRLEELANDERIRLKSFDKKISSFESSLSNLQDDFKQLEERLEQEKQDRIKLESDLKKTNNNLSNLQAEVKENGLTTKSLLDYKKLKQKRKELLVKLDSFEEKKNIQSTKEIFNQWIATDKQQNKRFLQEMPLSADSSWAKQYSKEQLKEYGWQVVDSQETNFVWLEFKINELINHNIKDLDSVFSSLEKETLVKELAQNEELLLEICQELGLKFPSSRKEISKKDYENKEKIKEYSNYSLKMNLFIQNMQEIMVNKLLISSLSILFIFLTILSFFSFKRSKKLIIKNKKTEEQTDNKSSSNWFLLIFLAILFSNISNYFLYKKWTNNLNKEEIIKEIENSLTKKLDLEFSEKKNKVKNQIEEELKDKELKAKINQTEIFSELKKNNDINKRFQRIIQDIRNINPQDEKSINRYLKNVKKKHQN